MKKKTGIKAVVNVYDVLDNATLGKLEVPERFTYIKALHALKKINGDFNDFREDAVKRLKPEDYDAIAEKVGKFNKMKPEEKEAALNDSAMTAALDANGEFMRQLNECLGDELDKEVEVEFAPLSEEAFGRLMESNGAWTAGTIMAAQELLCE